MGGQNSKAGGVRPPSSSLHLRDKKELAGVGVIFRKSPEGLLVVKEIVGGSSADECGMIQPGDILTKVDETKVAKASIADVSSLVLGEWGQTVKLKFSRIAGKSKKKIKVTLKRSVRATLEPTYHVQRDGINTRVTHIHLDCLQNQDPGAEADAASSATSDSQARDVLDAQGNVVGPGLLQRARQARLAGGGEPVGVERLDPSHPAFPGNKKAKGTTRSGSVTSNASGGSGASLQGRKGSDSRLGGGGGGAGAGARMSTAGEGAGRAVGQLVGGAAGGSVEGAGGGGEAEGLRGVGGAIFEERGSELMSSSGDEDDIKGFPSPRPRAKAEAREEAGGDAPAAELPEEAQAGGAMAGGEGEGRGGADLLNAFGGEGEGVFGGGFEGGSGGPGAAPMPSSLDVAPPEAPEPSTAAEPVFPLAGLSEEVGGGGVGATGEDGGVLGGGEEEEEEEAAAAAAAPVAAAVKVEEEDGGKGEEDWEGLAQSRVAIFENKASQAKKAAGKLPEDKSVNLEQEWAKTAARAQPSPGKGEEAGEGVAGGSPPAQSAPPQPQPSPPESKPAVDATPVKATPPGKPALPSAGSAKKFGGGGDLAAMMAARKKAMDENDDDGYYF